MQEQLRVLVHQAFRQQVLHFGYYGRHGRHESC